MLSKHMRRVLWIVSVLLAASIVVAVAAWFLPVPTGIALKPTEHRITQSLLTLLACLHISAAVLFLMGLKEFKQRLKNAYFLICGGLVVTGLNMVQLPIHGLLNLWDNPWVDYGALSYPYTLGLLLVYFGLRSFAGALRIKSWLVNPMYILLGGIGIGLVAGFLLGDDVMSFKYDLAARTLNCVLLLLLSLLILKIKAVAGPLYNQALAWFFLAFGLAFLGQASVLLFNFFQTPEEPWVVLLFALSGVVYVKSGYAFNKMGEF